MLTFALALLAPGLPAAHTIAVVAGFIVIVAACYWFIRAVSIPEPWIYLVYLVALVAVVYAVIWIVGQV